MTAQVAGTVSVLVAKPVSACGGRPICRKWEENAMDCCGHGHAGVVHAWMASMPPMSVTAMLAGGVGPRGSTEAARTAETTAAALVVLRNSISVDVHSHGGKTGITSKAPPSGDLADAMRAGSRRRA
jgi:hypothetical protein